MQGNKRRIIKKNKESGYLLGVEKKKQWCGINSNKERVVGLSETSAPGIRAGEG